MPGEPVTGAYPGTSPYAFTGGTIKQAIVDISGDHFVDLEMEAGQISLHDVYLVHGSEPNRSPRPRRGMTLRFMPTTSHYDRALEAELHGRSKLKAVVRRPIYLMRGIDRCGRNEFENAALDRRTLTLRLDTPDGVPRPAPEAP